MQRVRREPFGTTPQGEPVERFTLASATGITASILTYGGIVQQLLAPDRDGERTNVVLGFATLDDYVAHNSPGGTGPYFGAVVGRYANRIAGARFTLDGVEHRLPANTPPSSTHGGVDGFDSKVWAARELDDGVELVYTSPDGEEGYPGTLDVVVAYTLADDGALRIEYRARTDAPTVLNLTNHTYWNLAGESAGSAIEDHVFEVAADRYLPADESLLPTGELAPVAGTPFDFTSPAALGARIRDGGEQLLRARGYDHTFVLREARRIAARLSHPGSGRRLEVETTEPGLHLYTGNFLDGTLVGTGGRVYRQSDGVALEAQHFADSPNRADFPSTVLRPGEMFASTTVFRLATDA